MRVIELSNHPGDMLAHAELRRQATTKRARARYEDELIRHQARVQAIRVKRDLARKQHRWREWLRLVLAVWTAKHRAPAKPAREKAQDNTDTEERIRAGIAGEQLVAVELGRALNDDWTLLRGYRNRRGEIDDLLVGPKGLFAVEVKNINLPAEPGPRLAR